jgi:hypothetical protein
MPVLIASQTTTKIEGGDFYNKNSAKQAKI